MKTLTSILICIAIFALSGRTVVAGNLNISDASAIPILYTQNEDSRVIQLRSFLISQQSPLADVSDHFISEADRLGLDWKLIAAIAGVESTFGKHIPFNSYNCWGWGVYTGTQDGIHFSDWKDGITQVSEGIRFRYIDRGAMSIEQIGRIYAASPVWSSKVRFFLQKIEHFVPTRAAHLAVTI